MKAKVRPIPKSVLIEPHEKGCTSNFSGLVLRIYFGNYRANENVKRGKHHYWYAVQCNNPTCHALKAVHSQVLAQAK